MQIDVQLHAPTALILSPNDTVKKNSCLSLRSERFYYHWKLIYWNIQGVSRLADITAGGDFLCLCDQKRSYKRVSDFGRLRSYGHCLILVHALVWTASYGTSWRVMYSAWWLIVCGSCNEQLAQFTTERQPVLRPAVAFSKTGFKHRSIHEVNFIFIL